jgi:8-oxo-dGTP pyrophosphatase MutT (NUDIX family)
MQPIHVERPETPRDAATVVLLRDSAEGLQVLLQRRSAQMANMAGVYVFPGGKLEKADSDADSLARLDQSAAQLHHQLGEPALSTEQASGLYVAALREAIEECGLLLAVHAAPQANLANLAERAPGIRAQLRAGQPFAQVLAEQGLQLGTQQLAPWSRWITPASPAMSTRRFDTRFFLAAAPAGQTAEHDNEEATTSVWLTPRTALEQYRDRHITLAPPQIMSLVQLVRYADVAQALQAARSRRPATIQPEPFMQDGLRTICYPGDPLHPVRERAMTGPTRLSEQNGRYWPEAGFAALFE